MSKPTSRETVERIVNHVSDAYGLSDDRTRWLIDQLTAKYAQPPTEVELLRQEVADLRALVYSLLARPVCPHTPAI